MPETEWHAHYHCTWCHGLKAKADIIFSDDKPLCKHGDCRTLYELATRPRSVPKSQARFEHG